VIINRQDNLRLLARSSWNVPGSRLLGERISFSPFSVHVSDCTHWYPV